MDTVDLEMGKSAANPLFEPTTIGVLQEDRQAGWG